MVSAYIRPHHLADTLNWGLRYAHNIIQLKDGGLLTGWEIVGMDAESLDDAVIDNELARLARGFGAFGDEDVFWITMVRREADIDTLKSVGEVPKALEIIEAERRLLLESEGEIYENKLWLFYVQRRTYEHHTDLQTVQYFEDHCEAIEARLGSVLSLRRMGMVEREVCGEPIQFNELLSALASLMHGVPRRLQNFDHSPILLLTEILTLDWEQNKPSEPAFLDGRALEMITVREFPGQFPRGVLQVLEEIGCEFIWTTRYAPMSRRVARAHLKTIRREWLQSGRNLWAAATDQMQQDDPYTSTMADATAFAMAKLDAQDVQYGQFVTTFAFVGKMDAPDGGLEDVREATKRVRAALQDAGFEMRREQYNLFNAWRGSLPGHVHRNPHEVMVSNKALVDLIPTRTLWRGEKTNPCNLFPQDSPPLLIGRGQTGEEFYFNLHHQDVGHTLVFGPTGGGKSVLMGLIAAEYLKYGGKVFYFDKGGSSRYLCSALGGQYIDLGRGDFGSIGPLQDAQLLGETWLRNWLQGLLQAQISSSDNAQAALQDIDRIAAGLMTSLRPSMDEAHIQSQFNPVRLELEKHSKGGIFADRTTHISPQQFNVFEMKTLLDSGNANDAALAMDYLAALINSQLDGSPSLIVIDEAWAFLDHPVFQERIKSWLKEARKSNCAIMMATQSLSDVTNNTLTPILLESCPTKIFLPNPSAKTQAARETYFSLGLSDKQIDLIGDLTPKRDYYIVQPQGQRIVDFRFGPSTLSLVARTSTQDSAETPARAKADPEFWRRDLEDLWSGSTRANAPRLTLSQRAQPKEHASAREPQAQSMASRELSTPQSPSAASSSTPDPNHKNNRLTIEQAISNGDENLSAVLGALNFVREERREKHKERIDNHKKNSEKRAETAKNKGQDDDVDSE